MKIISYQPQVPCSLHGYLYTSDDVAELGQDMMVIDLPTGVSVEVGWYPEGAANGSYRVCVRAGLALVGAPLFTRDASDLPQMLDQRLAKLSRRISDCGSDASDTTQFMYRDWLAPTAVA